MALLQGPDHVFALANPAYRDLTGRRDLLGKPLAEALPEIVEQGFVDLLDRVFASGIAFRATGQPVELMREGVAQTRMLDFVYQPIKDAAGTTTAIFVEANDVTERVIAETLLRESEERLQLALDASNGIGVWDWDLVANQVRTDARFARLYGVDPELAEQGGPIEAFFSHIHPEDAQRVRAEIEQAIRSGDRFSSEYRLVDGGGRIRWVTAQGRCSHDTEGRPIRFPGVSFEVTERREAEEAARKAAADLKTITEDQAFLFDLANRQRGLDSPDAIMRLSAGAIAERLGIDRVGFYRVVGEGAVQFGPCVASGKLRSLEGTQRLDMGGANAMYRQGLTLVTDDAANDPRFVGTDLARYSPAAVGVPLMRGGSWVASLYANQAEPRRWRAEEVALIEAVAQSAWDAVERAAAVIALRESEAKFRAIANSIDPMVWSTQPDGYHDYYNDRWYEYTGVPPVRPMARRGTACSTRTIRRAHGKCGGAASRPVPPITSSIA
ncbi:PAS domain-containing protein [Sphingomonas sp. J315]|uniref:PAS domain-containing protein n=1 Tax=Sphingomonas sp. J315 TaxID=2898433 RepID=UPI0021ADE745|nr:PAS domain-containing protein [Sphingomonas sp. J315]UUY00863.1 PAS domain-containing protein [Sphingomonas sp. J315]